MSERFNPHSKEYGSVQDLPKEKQQEFVDLEDGGFVKQEAIESEELAALAAITRKENESYLDIQHMEAKRYDEYRNGLFEG